jgi:hypothetical protein
MDKIDKLEGQLKKWMIRNLTLEGKILIVKTFGLSQLIYNMQCYGILPAELLSIERLIFKFIWSKKWKESRPIERISRKILKNSYENGGMNAPDIEALDRSLKLKQFIRCASCSHQVRLLQTILLNNAGYENVLNQEYFNILNDDPIISRSQDTINRLTDNNRERVFGGLDAANASTFVIDLTSSINIENYLKRKGKTFVYFNYRPLKDLGISNLNELLLEREITQNHDTRIRIENTLSQFDRNLVEIAENYNEDFNNNNTPELYILDSESILKNISSFSVKELQKVMKTILSKIESLNVTNKNNLQDFNFDMNNIRKFRKQCKEVKQRTICHPKVDYLSPKS